jgi:hypothetical protein
VHRVRLALAVLTTFVLLTVMAPSAPAVTVGWDRIFSLDDPLVGGLPTGSATIGDSTFVLLTDFNACHLVRLEADGSVTWVRDIGPARELQCWDVATDGTRLYVAMQAWGTLDGIPHGEKAEAYVRAFSAGGSVLWTSIFTGDDSQTSWAIAASSGRVYLAGGIYHPLGVSDAYIRCFQKDGTVVWTRRLSSGGNDVFLSAAADADGVYVGWTDFEKGAAIRRYTADGTADWVRPFPPASTEILGLVRSGGALFAAGSTDGALEDKESLGSRDAWVMSVDPASGSVNWSRQFGSGGYDLGSALSVGPSGIYVAGETTGALPRFENRGDLDAFVRSYTFDGHRRWTRQFGTHRSDRATAIAADAAGVTVFGETTGNLGDAHVGPRTRVGFARRWIPA